MKKALSLLLALCMVIGCLAGCGSTTEAPAETPAETPADSTTESTTDAAPEKYEGTNVFDAIAFAKEKYPNAKVIRYANQTSTATFTQLGGGIPALVLYLAIEVPYRTEGRYRIELYPDGTLAKSLSDVITGLTTGAFDMNCYSSGNFGEFTDAFAEINVPFFFGSIEEVHDVLSAGLLDDMYARAEEDISGILFNGVSILGMRNLNNTKHVVTTPADVEGLKLRIQNDPIQIAAFEALGATITSISYSELYTSIQQKVIDGEDNPFQNLVSDKLAEVLRYTSTTNHICGLQFQMISETFWNSLSAEDQAIIDEIITESNDYAYEVVSDLQEYYGNEINSMGCEVTYLTAEQIQAFKDVMDEKGVFDQCIELMGQERWDALNSYLESVK